MIDDIIRKIENEHGSFGSPNERKANILYAKNWAFDYYCTLAELHGVDPRKDRVQYFIDQTRLKFWEMYDVVHRVYEDQSARSVHLMKALKQCTGEEVARYEWNCGRYKWER